MMAKRHGTRPRYSDGCRCAKCAEVESSYQRDYRERKALGLVGRRDGEPSKRLAATVVSLKPAVAAESGDPGRVELGVEAEIAGLAQAELRPGLAQAALELARVLDNPRALGQKAAASKALAEILGTLHKGTDVRKSRLAGVRAMAKPQSATG